MTTHARPEDGTVPPLFPTSFWHRVPRTAQIILFAGMAALLVDLVVLTALHLRRAPDVPLSPLFRSSAAVRELQRMCLEQPRDPEWQVRLGSAYLEDGHYLSAVASFQAALQLQGPEVLCRRRLATAYGKAGRNHEALTEWRRLAVLNPRDLTIPLQIAAELLALDQGREARATLDAVPRDAEGFPAMEAEGGRLSAAELLAAAYLDLGQARQAYELSQLVLRVDGNRPAAQLIAGHALLERGKPRAAAAAFRAVLRVSPDDPNAKLQLARSLLLEGRPADEPEVLRLLEPLAANRDVPAQVRFELARIYARRRQWQAAAESYKAAYQGGINRVASLRGAFECYFKAGQPEDAHYFKGLYFETQEDYAAAIRAYSELVNIHSCCHSGYMHVARVQRRMGRADQALASLKKALKLPNPPAKVHSELARTYGLLKQPNNEAAAWQEFIRLDAANADLGYQHLGRLADVAGRIDEAERLYRKCVELYPNADLYRLRLAKLLLQRRSDPSRLREAVEHLEKAVVIAPLNPDGFFDVGVAYRYANRPQEAVWALRHAIDLDPGNGMPYQPLGEVLMEMGRREEGEETLALFRKYRSFYQAWETLQARTRRDPRDITSRRKLAAFYEHSGALYNALETYTEILTLRPQDAHARRRVDELYRRIGQSSEDVPVLNSAASGPGATG